MSRPLEPAADRAVVCVQGLGFVGAAMALAVASARDERGMPRFSVVGLDLPTPLGQERIDALNRGEFPFRTSDPALAAAAAATRRAGNLTATSDPATLARADVVVVDVHLDVGVEGKEAAVDFAPFRAAVLTVGTHVRPGALVIVETTVPPGTCERVVAPELAGAMRARGLPEDAVLLAHSYERVMPGEDYLASITNFWRVYSGRTPEAADACERFLSQVINVRDFPLTRLASTTASETAKVLENSFRATNIAFIEEWGRFAEAVGIDLFEVIEAIRVRPTHCNIRQPGFGVGGYCLTKDPLFAGIAARDLFGRPDLEFPFSQMAVRVNARMPLVTVERLRTVLGDLAGKRVLLMGVAYRPEVADTRYSPAQTFVEEMRRRGAVVLVHDPLVTDWPELQTTVASELPAASALDAVVMAVPHRAYRELDLAAWLGGARPVFLDANAVLTPAQRRALRAAGCPLHAIGEG
jgi:nucleotide sugar dehydrogenase